ncbi:hypothetical protein CNY67_13565 [Desulfovibrio sp. G11]|nr:hypothetical protein CNY67_13565 [Desulfovibrio sp. G11]
MYALMARNRPSPGRASPDKITINLPAASVYLRPAFATQRRAGFFMYLFFCTHAVWKNTATVWCYKIKMRIKYDTCDKHSPIQECFSS